MTVRERGSADATKPTLASAFTVDTSVPAGALGKAGVSGKSAQVVVQTAVRAATMASTPRVPTRPSGPFSAATR